MVCFSGFSEEAACAFVRAKSLSKRIDCRKCLWSIGSNFTVDDARSFGALYLYPLPACWMLLLMKTGLKWHPIVRTELSCRGVYPPGSILDAFGLALVYISSQWIRYSIVLKALSWETGVSVKLYRTE